MATRQAAILASGLRRSLHTREWKTWGSSVGRRRGARIRSWGIIEELHSPDKLLLDFDSASPPAPALNSLVHTCGMRVKWQRWDRTKRGWHLTVKLFNRLSDGEIIAAQAILGSDLARERLNLSRAISIRLHPSEFWKRRINVLFKHKLKVRPK